MKPNPTKSFADRSAGAGGPVTEPPSRPKINRLVLLIAGLFTVVLGLYLVRGPRSSPPVAAPVEPAPAAVSAVSPAANDSPPTAVLASNGVLVDARGPMATMAPASSSSIAAQWGIEITKVGVAAGGKALDLRYKVLDVAKATSMLYLTNLVYVFNHSNNKVLMVPFQRENQTSQKLVAGKTYFTLLPNKEGRVQSGNTVTVVLGGSRAENLVVN